MHLVVGPASHKLLLMGVNLALTKETATIKLSAVLLLFQSCIGVF